MNLICYPPAPLNGGRLESAPPKVGEWVWQPKVDDRRVVIHAPSQTIWNQYGALSVGNKDKFKFQIALDVITAAWKQLPYLEWFDAGLMEYRHDMMRGCIVIFDLICRPLIYTRRRELLNSAFQILPSYISKKLGDNKPIRDSVFLIPEYVEYDDVISPSGGYFDSQISSFPLNAQEYLQAENARIGKKFYEGLVAKKIDSLYYFGVCAKEKTPDWIKHRFDNRG